MLARQRWPIFAQGAGLAFVPESATSLAEAAGRLCAMSAEEGRGLGDHRQRFYAERLSFRRCVEAMVHVYQALLGGEAA